MPRRRRFGVLYCVCQVLMYNKDPDDRKKRVPVVSKQRCGWPAPHKALKNQHDDFQPEIPNLYGEPLCKTHADLADEPFAFPRPGSPLYDPLFPTAYSLREASSGPRRPHCRYSRCEGFVVVPTEQDPKPMYCRYHTKDKLKVAKEVFFAPLRCCRQQKHARCVAAQIEELKPCRRPKKKSCSTAFSCVWLYEGERRYVLIARARRFPCKAVRTKQKLPTEAPVASSASRT